MGKSLDWKAVYDFWFPAELARGDLPYFLRLSEWWMRGGATPELPPFLPFVESAMAGELDHWAQTSKGRLCLIVVLDQFPRGHFAGTARAFINDQASLAHCEKGFQNGHYRELKNPFEQFFFTLPMIHAEGPDHLDRLHRVLEEHLRALPDLIREWPALRPIFEFSTSQIEGNIEVIKRFGRFPHRNEALGRPSTFAEQAYIAKGDFVHRRAPPIA